MSTICANRVDFRLIHGQVASQWCRMLDIQRIVVFDDEAAKDEFNVKILKLAAPQGTRVNVYTVEDGIERWNKDQFGKGRTLVLFKTIETAVRVYELGYHFDELVIGQVPGAANRRIAYKTINLSDDELEMLNSLHQQNVNVVFQMVPDEDPGKFVDIYNRMKNN